MKELIIVRTHQADEDSLRAFDRYQSCASSDVVFVCDERRGHVDMGPRAKIGFDNPLLRKMKLFPHAQSGWRCGDYSYYVARQARPDYDRYWMVEPDVWLNFSNPSTFFSGFTNDDADFLAPTFGTRDHLWGWYGTVEGKYPTVHGCFFPITRISARAIDHLFQARKAASAQPDIDPVGWPNDEAFVASELIAHGFKCRDLNALGRRVYTAASIRHDIPHDSEALLQSAADQLIYHPARSFEPWLAKLDDWMNKFETFDARANASRLLGAARTLAKRPGCEEAALIPLLLTTEAWTNRPWASAVPHISAEADSRKSQLSLALLNKTFAPNAKRKAIGTAYLVQRTPRAQGTRTADPNDFKLRFPQPIALLPRDQALPYCWDLRTRELLFTLHLRPGEVLKQPFLYAAQRLMARVAVKVPLHDLDEIYGAPDSAVSPIFILSIGRTGSTLLDSLMEILTPKTVSEPDTVTQIAQSRAHLKEFDSATRRRLLWHSISPFITRFGGGGILSIKFRSQVNGLVTDLIDTFPDAKYVFMLRERSAWARSTFRAFGLQPRAAALRLIQGLNALRALSRSGAKVIVLTSEELVSAPRNALARIVETPLPDSVDARIAAIMAVDSQRGTAVSKIKTSEPKAGENEWLSEFERVWMELRPATVISELGLQL